MLTICDACYQQNDQSLAGLPDQAVIPEGAEALFPILWHDRVHLCSKHIDELRTFLSKLLPVWF